jgi:N-acetylglucosamine malate deacetylase 2
MTSYHLGPEGLHAGDFLPDVQADARGVTIELTPEECADKRALLACFASQKDTLRWFRVDVERFRPAPRYDFLRPPHAGPLFYEQHAWGMTGSRFRELAAQALEQLQLEGRL